MSNPNKQQGTGFERWVLRFLQSFGLTVRRLAEGGRFDPGDLELTIGNTTWHIECRFRQRMTVHAALDKARQKANLGPTALFWKRLVPVEGKARRQAVGVSTVVVLTPEDYAHLATWRDGQHGHCTNCLCPERPLASDPGRTDPPR